MQKCQQPVTGVTGVTRVTNLITMGILAVTRAAETCNRCDNPAMRVAAAGSVSADPLPFHAPGRNADPHPMMDCSHSFHDGAPTPLRGLVFRHRDNGAGERTVGLSQLI
jgi:hypothetical protein